MGSTTPTDGHLRAALLDQARDAVTRDRAATHGRAEDSFASIAALWSAHLGIAISAPDVAQLMVLLKLARAKGNPGHADNWIDMAGYAAIGGELGGAAVPGREITLRLGVEIDSRGWPVARVLADPPEVREDVAPAGDERVIVNRDPGVADAPPAPGPAGGGRCDG
ncbi:DUF6378 domain-containing protein [Amaricoccus solimangrovi]|uniref:DUF6378 domain-containing protein n=1 Tax=Amaricoccus solimangrovi TaxID=2589815 RepID=UPI0015E3C1BC|nr:DUF6378 domain-containing protein [Amaricoccus solimangrovi]